LGFQSLSATLAVRTFAFVNIGAVGSINVPAVAASDLIYPLQVIGTRQACISDYNLSVPVDVSRLDPNFPCPVFDSPARWLMQGNVLTDCHTASDVLIWV
jgi:hypothetical protein